MDILTMLAVTLMTLGTVYLLMLVAFNAVAIWFIVKYWKIIKPYWELSFRALKKQMDEEMRNEKLREGLKSGEIKYDCACATKCKDKLPDNKCGLPYGTDCDYQDID